MTRVIVASDSAAAQAELAAALARRPSLTIIARSSLGAELSARVSELSPDVVVVDIADGALAEGPTGSAIYIGVTRDVALDDLAATVDAVAAGLTVARREPNQRPSAAVDVLTRREHEVLNLLADGLGNKMIAARLGISDHTVKAHLAAIFDKLHVSTRAEAVALGLRLGLVAL